MERRIVWTDQMSLTPAQSDTAAQVPSSVRTPTAPPLRQSVTAQTTAVMVPTRLNVLTNVHFSNSNANQVVVVFWIAGNAMATPIVKTTATKTRPCATTGLATPIRNSPAKTVDASLNFGCAISTTTAVMILMSQPTCVGRRIVQLDGEDAQAHLTTDAYLNGCSVMEKTIVETDLMSCQRIVQHATRKQTLLAKI